MPRLLAIVFAALCFIAAGAGGANAAASNPGPVYATTSDIACGGDDPCSLKPNITILSVSYGGLTGSANYAWSARCPSASLPKNFCIRPAGATGYFVLTGFQSTGYVGISLSQYLANGGTIATADAAGAEAGRPCYGNVNYTLPANETLHCKWIMAGGVITLGSHNLSGDVSCPQTIQCFDVSGTGVLTPATSDTLTPENLGCGVSASATTCTTAIQALMAMNITQHFLGRTYKVNGLLFSKTYNPRIDEHSAIYQTGTNVPIMAVSQIYVGQAVSFPSLIYPAAQPSTNINSVGLVLNNFAQGRMNVYVENAAIGVYNPPYLASHVAAGAAAGATSLTLENAQTDAAGAFGIVPGMEFTVTADDGRTTEVVHLTSVSGAVVGISPALEFPISGTRTNAFVSDYNTVFSSTIRAFVRRSSYSCGWFGGRRTITKFEMMRCYGDGPAPESPFTTPKIASYPWYFAGGLNDIFDGINVEHYQISTDAVFINENVSVPGPSSFLMTGAHFESINFLTGGRCLLAGYAGGANIGPVVEQQVAALTANIGGSPACAFGFGAPTGGAGYYQKQIIVNVAVPRFGGNILDAATNFVAFRDKGSSGKVLYDLAGPPIFDIGSGMTMRNNLYVGNNVIRKMGDYLPDGTVGFASDIPMTDTAAHPVRLLPNGSQILAHIYAVHARPANGVAGLTTATMGIYSDAGRTLISNSATTALSPLVDGRNYVDLGVGGMPANGTISNGTAYYKCGATQANGAGVAIGASGQSTYSGGRTGSTAVLIFTSALPWTVGTSFLGDVTGSSHTNLNLTSAWITVVSPTELEYYVPNDGTGVAFPTRPDNSTTTVTQTPTVSLDFVGDHIPPTGVN